MSTGLFESDIAFAPDGRACYFTVTLPPALSVIVEMKQEKGIWTAQSGQWNNKFLDRLKKVQGAWKTAIQEATAKSMSEKDFTEFWLKKRGEITD